MKKILFTLFSSLCATATFAQNNTVTGTITDCHGDPVNGQIVYIYTTDSVAMDTTFVPVSYSTSTNASGIYSFDVPYSGGSQGLTVSTYENYSPWSYFYTSYSATSSGNTFSHDFNVSCDPDTIHTIIHGVVYDCSGAPFTGYHEVYAQADSSLGASDYYYGQVVVTDPVTGEYTIDVNYPTGALPLAILVSTQNPSPYPGYTTDTVYIYDTTTITRDLHTTCVPYPCDIAFFYWHDSTGIAGDTVYLFAYYYSINPASATFSWDYGDAESGSGVYTSHTYSAEGSYTVCLTVDNPADSCHTTYCQDIDFTTMERASGVVLITNLQAITGIKEPAKQETSFTVYPNPADNLLNIKSNADIKTARIFDMSGRQVINMNMAGVQNNMSLDISNLESGSYLLSLYNQNNELLHTHPVLKR